MIGLAAFTLAHFTPVSDFPVFLRCNVTVTLPRPQTFPTIVMAVNAEWSFDRAFSTVTGVTTAHRVATEPELRIEGASAGAPRRMLTAILSPDDSLERMAFDWRVTEIDDCGAQILHASGVGDCRNMSPTMQDKAS